MAKVLIYVGSSLPLLWGGAHFFPTKSIVKGFGEISEDNKNILTMEWLIEGIALIFIGISVVTITAIEPQHVVSTTIYILSAACLVVLAIVSLFTGFRINFLPFKLCPIIFTSSAILIITGWLLL
jgi:hypothetical protein